MFAIAILSSLLVSSAGLPVPQQRTIDARLDEARAACAAGRTAQARSVYDALAADPAAPDYARACARLMAAHTFVMQKRYGDARSAYLRLLKDAELPASFRMEADEALREIPRLKAGLPGRDPGWERVRLPKDPKPGRELFVASNGSDRNPGTPKRPLATLGRARDAIRAMKAHGGLPRGGVLVTVKGGDYRMQGPLALDSQDSGTAQSPVVYRAARGESPVFDGGVRLRGFHPVTDAAALARIPEVARAHVVQLDLHTNGVADLGAFAPHGVGFAAAPVPELYFGGREMPLARWPNEGWATTGRIVQERTPSGGFAFEYEGDRPARWLGARDAWLHGYFGWLWADSAVGLASIDPAHHTVTTAQVGAYAPKAGMPYFVYNLLEELDAPGEWYLDRDTGILYFHPPSDQKAAAVEFSVLPQPFISMTGVSHVRLERLTFQCGRSDGLVLKGCGDCLVAGCTVQRLGGTGVTVEGGLRDGIFGCDIEHVGRGGVSVTGGDRRALRSSDHFVENCHIHDFSWWDRTYTPAVFASGVAIRIAHNLIHDSPGHAMRIEGNNHLIELNDVHDVAYETDDQGALDMWFDPTYRGVVIRDNFWHYVGTGTDKRMRAGIRLDDAISGVTIYRNVFYKASDGYFGGVQIHGGKENVVDSNLFVSCRTGISFSRWGAERWRQFLASPEVRKATTEAVDISRPPYSTRYPALAHLEDSPDVNRIWRNVTINCVEFMARDGGIEQTIDNVTQAAESGASASDPIRLLLKPGSRLLTRTGLSPIPFAEIGLYKHPLRASWPIVNSVGRHYGG